jgi:hypothetical protein
MIRHRCAGAWGWGSHLAVDAAKREDHDHHVLRGPRAAVEAELCHPRCPCDAVAWLMHVAYVRRAMLCQTWATVLSSSVLIS